MQDAATSKIWGGGAQNIKDLSGVPDHSVGG